MSTSTLRVPTSFRLPAELLEELKECAKATNRSLNNYVESILMDFMSKNKTMEENAITPDLQAKLEWGGVFCLAGRGLAFLVAG